MRVIQSSQDEHPVTMATFGTYISFTDKADMEPEDFLSLLMSATVFERRTKESAYPLIEEAAWEVMLEY